MHAETIQLNDEIAEGDALTAATEERTRTAEMWRGLIKAVLLDVLSTKNPGAIAVRAVAWARCLAFLELDKPSQAGAAEEFNISASQLSREEVRLREKFTLVFPGQRSDAARAAYSERQKGKSNYAQASAQSAYWNGEHKEYQRLAGADPKNKPAHEQQ